MALVRLPQWVWNVVGGAASAMAVLSISANHLWMSPEARGYVVLAGGIAEPASGQGPFDFSHDLFLVRPPGYPLFLAACFSIFGEHSPVAIQILQHLMVFVTIMLVVQIAWELSSSALVACLSGLCAVANVQWTAFANMVMSEVPFALATVSFVYWIVRFHRSGRILQLVAASVAIGVSYLIRPIGLVMMAVCLAAVVYRLWFQRHRSERDSRETGPQSPCSVGRPNSFWAHGTCALLPAMFLAGPWMAYMAARSDGMGAGFGPTLFGRLVTLDRLDSTESPTWVEIQTVVSEAKIAGKIAPNADPRREGTVIDAYSSLGRASYAEVCQKMQRAGVELFREHWSEVLQRSLRYTAWTLFGADSSFRFFPGNAKGVQLGGNEWVRDPDAVFFDCATYQPMMLELIGRYARFLPLRSDSTSSTPIWAEVVHAYWRFTVKLPRIGGSPDTYGACIVICLGGLLVSMTRPNRFAWLLMVAVIGLQVVGSSILVGPMPRYAVPIQPLLSIGGVFFIWRIVMAPYWGMKRLTGLAVQGRRHEIEGLSRARRPRLQEAARLE